MACSNNISINELLQIIAVGLLGIANSWQPVSSDRRYEEKYWKRHDGGSGRMTRPVGEITNTNKPDYPHYTEIYDANWHRQNYIRKGDEVTNWDAHYSYIDDNGKIQHTGAHKTAQAIMDDLESAIQSLK